MYVCINICIYIHMHVYICIYIYMYILYIQVYRQGNLLAPFHELAVVVAQVVLFEACDRFRAQALGV